MFLYNIACIIFITLSLPALACAYLVVFDRRFALNLVVFTRCFNRRLLARFNV